MCFDLQRPSLLHFLRKGPWIKVKDAGWSVVKGGRWFFEGITG